MKRIGLLVLCAAFSAAGQTSRVISVEEQLNGELVQKLQGIDDSLPGVLGVAVIDLAAGRTIAWHGDSVFPQASSIKIPIMVEVFHAVRENRLKLADKITLRADESVGGSGHLRIVLRAGPVTLTVADLVTAMIEASDNTATNKLIRMVGAERVNASMERLGFPNTRLGRIMMDSAAARRGEENLSTPLEMAGLAELIYRGKAVDAEASKQMIETLTLVEADFRAAIPAGIPVASKPGAVDGVRCETGIVLLPGRPFVLSVMSTFLDEGANPVQQVARLVYNHFAKLAASNRYGNRIQ